MALCGNIEDNPADFVSRGMDSLKLKTCELWWNGPKFLMSNQYPQRQIPVLFTWSDQGSSRPWRRRAAIFRKLRSACVEVGTHRRKSACVEVGSTHKHLRRGVNSNNFNYITCEEVKSVESKFSSIIGYIRRASNKGARKKR
ncbi:hypothetical protein TNCV_563801 [Trichonephila clavipes]|nr:hypothetical protein TNCV_563801 [Trichonephila clavipes]